MTHCIQNKSSELSFCRIRLKHTFPIRQQVNQMHNWRGFKGVSSSCDVRFQTLTILRNNVKYSIQKYAV